MVDVQGAAAYNRTAAAKTGWLARFYQIVQVLGFGSRTPGEAEFAQAVADWQTAHNKAGRPPKLTVDGKLGPKTWAQLEPHTEFSVGEPMAPPPSLDGPEQTKAAEKRVPSGFKQTIWPKPPHAGANFAKVGTPTRPNAPAGLAVGIPVELAKTKIIEIGRLAYQFEVTGELEFKLPAGEQQAAAALKNLGGESKVTPGAIEHKIEYAITENLKISANAGLSKKEQEEIEKEIAKGNFTGMAKKLAAAKLAYQWFPWLETEGSLSTDLPCIAAVAGKLILEPKTALELIGASPAEIASLQTAMTGKVELVGSFKVGPSTICWAALGARLGAKGIEVGARAAPSAFGRALGAFLARLNILATATEVSLYLMAFSVWLCDRAREAGRQRAFWAMYCQAYVYEADGNFWKLNTGSDPFQRKALTLGANDATRAVNQWGRAAVAEALLDEFGVDPIHGADFGVIKRLGDRSNDDALAMRFSTWCDKHQDELLAMVQR